MHVLIFISMLCASFHPVHVAFTNVEYDNENEEIIITSRIFYDDMELSIKQMLDTDLQLETENEQPEANEFIRIWFSKSLEFSINGEEIPPEHLTLINREKQDIAMRLIFRMKASQIKTIQVKNKIMTNLYADQSNLMIFKFGKLEQSFSLTADNNMVTLEVE